MQRDNLIGCGNQQALQDHFGNHDYQDSTIITIYEIITVH